MFHNLELGVLALGHDELAVQVAIGHEPGYVLHHSIVGPDGIGGDYVHVRKAAGHGDGLAAADKLLLLQMFRCCHYCMSSIWAISSPYCPT